MTQPNRGSCSSSWFPPIREFREKSENFFQSGKSGKTEVFSFNQGKNVQIREKVKKSDVKRSFETILSVLTWKFSLCPRCLWTERPEGKVHNSVQELLPGIFFSVTFFANLVFNFVFNKCFLKCEFCMQKKSRKIVLKSGNFDWPGEWEP